MNNTPIYPEIIGSRSYQMACSFLSHNSARSVLNSENSFQRSFTEGLSTLCSRSVSRASLTLISSYLDLIEAFLGKFWKFLRACLEFQLPKVCYTVISLHQPARQISAY